MAWFKIDDNLAFHPKVIAAGNAAMGLWSRAGAWASHQMTDGFIPDAMVATLGTRPQADKLVRAGLWIRVSGGFSFHEWSERNPDSASVRARKESESRGASHGNHIRWHVKRQVSVPECEFCVSGTRSGGESPKGESPVPSRPVGTTTTSTAARTDDPEGFAEFWAVYPRKDAKRKAAQAFKAALKRADAQTIIAGAKAYASVPREPQFVAMPTTWLNGDRWADEGATAVKAAPAGGGWDKGLPKDPYGLEEE